MQHDIQGYRIAFDVLPDGFRVSDPSPIPAGPEAGAELSDAIGPGDVVPDLTTAIKHVLAVVKGNPVNADEQEAFAASVGSPMGKNSQGGVL